MLDDSAAIGEEMKCPTCNARQAWSAECRRCKSDLRLLRGFAGLAQRLRKEALLELHAGRIQDARRAAEAWHRVDRSAAAARLLAVCHLLAGDPAPALAAVQTSRTLERRPTVSRT